MVSVAHCPVTRPVLDFWTFLGLDNIFGIHCASMLCALFCVHFVLYNLLCDSSEQYVLYTLLCLQSVFHDLFVHFVLFSLFGPIFMYTVLYTRYCALYSVFYFALSVLRILF